MRCREADDPFTKLGQYLFALHSLAARFSRMITPEAGNGPRAGQARRPVLQSDGDTSSKIAVGTGRLDRTCSPWRSLLVQGSRNRLFRGESLRIFGDRTPV